MQAYEYDDQGAGVPVVFLHGFCESRVIWNDLIHDIKIKYRCISLDFPGFGDANRMDSLHSMQEYADWVSRFLDYLSIPKCIVVGHSLGGYVGLELMKHIPNRIEKLILVNSTMLEDDLPRKQNRDRSIRFIERNSYAMFVAIFVPSLFQNTEREKWASVIEILKQEALKASEDAVLKTTVAMRNRSDYQPIGKKYSSQIYFIAGALDFTLPEEKRKLNQQLLPKKNFFLLPTVGHMAMFEDKPNVKKILLDQIFVK